MATTETPFNPFDKSKNQCSHCKQINLPEPIVFAKMCRLTGDYVCDGCYVASLYTIIDTEGRS